jgi:hypothetical protein
MMETISCHQFMVAGGQLPLAGAFAAPNGAFPSV